MRAKQARESRKARLAEEQGQAALLETLRTPRRVQLCREKRAAALYIRTSRIDQHPENQLPELRKLAALRGLEVIDIFEEQISAVKERPAFERMQSLARMGAFNVVLVWAIDRLGRSMFDVVHTIRELDDHNCTIISVRENWLDTAGPLRQLLIAIFGWIAEQERERLIERTHAGLLRAKADGRTLGRPRIQVDLAEVATLGARGVSVRQIARTLGYARSTLARAVAQNGRANGAAK